VVSARCAEESGELLVQSAIHQLKKLQRNKVPYRPVFSRMIAPQVAIEFFLVRRHVADAARVSPARLRRSARFSASAHDFCELMFSGGNSGTRRVVIISISIQYSMVLPSDKVGRKSLSFHSWRAEPLRFSPSRSSSIAFSAPLSSVSHFVAQAGLAMAKSSSASMPHNHHGLSGDQLLFALRISNLTVGGRSEYIDTINCRITRFHVFGIQHLNGKAVYPFQRHDKLAREAPRLRWIECHGQFLFAADSLSDPLFRSLVAMTFNFNLLPASRDRSPRIRFVGFRPV